MLSRIRLLTCLALFVSLPAMGGCAVAHLAGAMMQNEEYQKQVDTPARYGELSGRRTAVLVNADRGILFDHPSVVDEITAGVSYRLARDVEGSQMLDPAATLRWKWETRQWDALPYSELATRLDVDRIIYVDLYEFRLNPPGNRWQWEAVCAGNVSVIERDGFDPDAFVDTFNVISTFPSVSNLTRAEADEQSIRTGIMAEFIKHTCWLFHDHLEPKHPDKFRPELERQAKGKK